MNDQHVARRVVRDRVGHRAAEQPADYARVRVADDDQIRAAVDRRGDQGLALVADRLDVAGVQSLLLEVVARARQFAQMIAAGVGRVGPERAAESGWASLAARALPNSRAFPAAREEGRLATLHRHRGFLDGHLVADYRLADRFGFAIID